MSENKEGEKKGSRVRISTTQHTSNDFQRITATQHTSNDFLCVPGNREGEQVLRSEFPPYNIEGKSPNVNNVQEARINTRGS